MRQHGAATTSRAAAHRPPPHAAVRADHQPPLDLRRRPTMPVRERERERKRGRGGGTRRRTSPLPASVRRPACCRPKLPPNRSRRCLEHTPSRAPSPPLPPPTGSPSHPPPCRRAPAAAGGHLHRLDLLLPGKEQQDVAAAGGLRRHELTFLAAVHLMCSSISCVAAMDATTDTRASRPPSLPRPQSPPVLPAASTVVAFPPRRAYRAPTTKREGVR